MKTYSILFDRQTEDVLVRAAKFLEEASRIEGVSVDEKQYALMFDPDKEPDIMRLSEKYGIVDFTKQS